MPKFQVTVNKCKVCSKTVYPMEELIADEHHYHKPCFRCSQCNRTLSTGTYASLDGAIFCKPHFLQLFKQKGNYEEGFGKERYKNKWGGVHVEKAPSGQTVIVNGAAPPTNGTTPEDKENVPESDAVDSGVPTNGHSANSTREPTPVRPKRVFKFTKRKDSSEDGIIEESALSLQEKKSKLYESSHKEIPKASVPSKAAPGKLAKWQPKSFDEGTSSSKPKPAPKKLNINWSAQASVKRDEQRSTDDQPEWVRKVRDRNLKFGELGSVKTKFETGDVGKKEYKSEAVRDETRRPSQPIQVDAVVKSVSGVTSHNKSRFETREERQYDTTKRQELEQLAFARSQPQEEKQEEEMREEKETEENTRYKELEQFRRHASTKDSKNKFESGPFSNAEKKELEARKEVQSFHGKGLARNTKEMYEKGDYSKPEYVSPVKQEITTIHADTLSKREMYESGGNKDTLYESETMKELETLQTEASSTKSKFESGELVRTEFETTANKEDLESMRAAAAAADTKKKYESGELLKRDFDSETRKEVATLKTDAQSTKSKYESGELVRTEFDSETKQELSSIKSDARVKKDKYESGDVEHVQYDSEVKKEVESMRGQVEASNILDKYQREVEEGNKVMTSKPVTIERSKPEDYVTRDDDEDLRVQSSHSSSELSSPEYEEAADANEIEEYDDLNDYEYVSMPTPNKMTNIEDRFKKEEVEKPEVKVNKINIPTFEKEQDSDQELIDAPSELEAEEMRKQLWSSKASDVKSRFEASNQPEIEVKGTPNQIDLQAEVNGYED